MQIEMKYGKKGLILDIPPDIEATVVEKKRMPVLLDGRGAVLDALDRPKGSARLSEEARGCSSACILVCDVTRPVPNALILPPS